VLETLPDFYGDEITLDSITATGACANVLDLSSAQAAIEGDYPSRCRIVVTDTSGHDQHGMLWGVRSRHYDSASTAALVYEAEALTPLNGAAVTALAGASGGDVVKLTIPVSGIWVPMLATDLLAGTRLTHHGSYRVWARAYSSAAVPQLQLLWGVGSLSAPSSNDRVALQGAGAFYLVDLGTVRLDQPAAGTHAWVGVIQAQGNSGDDIQVDQVYLQPLDESAGQLRYANAPSATVLSSTAPSGTTADATGVGTVTWHSPAAAATADGIEANALLDSSSPATHYLMATGLGFSIPSGATIHGIEATVRRNAARASAVIDNRVRLVKAGTVQTPDHSSPNPWPAGGPGAPVATTYGASNDLWGAAWTPADINDPGFGIAIAATWFAGTAVTAYVDSITLVIYFTLSSGFTIAQDAVVYANHAAEIRSEAMERTQDGTVYGPISQVVGDLPRMVPSGVEGRAVELFVKPSRGDLDTLADSGLDGFSVQVIYRPCYLARP
jgi:hypothetical protein